MDEYRPFPTEQLPDTTGDTEDQSGPEEHEARERPDALAAHLDAADEPDEPDEGEEDEGPGGRRSRHERPAPDTDHPGGHLHGTVVRLNRPRRFGFLRADDGVEVFFHASALEAGPSAFDVLRPGQEAEFDCHQDEQGRGLAATLVTPIGEPPEPPVRQPKQPRAERPERAERGERGERPARGGRQGAERWRVSVLRERQDASVAGQLERLLNERNVKPGQFTISLIETDDGVECWVAYHQGDGK